MDHKIFPKTQKPKRLTTPSRTDKASFDGVRILHGPCTLPLQPSRESRADMGGGALVPGWRVVSHGRRWGAMAVLLGPLARVLEGVHDLGLGRSLLHLVVVLPARGLGQRHEDRLDATTYGKRQSKG